MSLPVPLNWFAVDLVSSEEIILLTSTSGVVLDSVANLVDLLQKHESHH